MNAYKRFKTYKEAEEYCNSLGLRYDHSASAKGYQPSKSYGDWHPYYTESYEGKFGNGVILNRPSKDGLPNGRHSNRFHKIEYYLKPQNV